MPKKKMVTRICRVCGKTDTGISRDVRGLHCSRECYLVSIKDKRVPNLKGNKYNLKHGKHGTRIYRIWQDMMRRCYNEKRSHYADYGARGIIVCDEWHEFANFLKDMGEPDHSLTLDRIDNEGNYEPGNCRWSTRKEQQRNKRTNRIIEFRGEKKPLIEWAEEMGIKSCTISRRLKYGWSTEEALTRPVQKKSDI